MRSSHPAFHLRYGWMAWPSVGTTLSAPPDYPVAEWEHDGLHLLEHAFTPHEIRLVVSAGPDLAPVDVARLLKGRLQHAMRKAAVPVNFSRKVALRAIGHNTRVVVERYIRNQLRQTELADSRYRDALQRHSFAQREVDLAQPSETNSGRYWFNLHVVLVTANRFRMGSEVAGRISTACRLPAVAKCAVMPDHLHLAVKADPAKSPTHVARSFQELTATATGMLGFWLDTFYVGTFGEYGMEATRP